MEARKPLVIGSISQAQKVYKVGARSQLEAHKTRLKTQLNPYIVGIKGPGQTSKLDLRNTGQLLQSSQGHLQMPELHSRK